MIFDGHSDIWTDITQKKLIYHSSDIFRNFHKEKLKKGGINGGIFVIWPDPPYDKDPYKRSFEIITCALDEILKNSDIFSLIKSHKDISSWGKSNKFFTMIGLEGLSSIGENIDLIDFYYNIGARHASLTWNESNHLATGWNGDEKRGLTSIGKKAIERLENLGMIIDLSHANDTTFWDISTIISKPIIASHSNVRSICGNKRNLTDDQLKFIKSTGGLVGINAFNEFIHEEPEKRNIHTLSDHIVYIADLIGIEHIAFGFDFCDFLESDTLGSFSQNEKHVTRGFEDASKANDLINILENRGFSNEDIEKISYKNYFRIFKEILKY